MDNNKLFLLDMSDKFAFIEDGVNALRILADGRESVIDSTMNEKTFTSAQEWIFDHLIADLQTARAEIHAEATRKKDA